MAITLPTIKITKEDIISLIEPFLDKISHEVRDSFGVILYRIK